MAKRHRDALKKARQDKKKNLRNRSVIAKIKTLRDKVLSAGTPDEKKKLLSSAISAAAKAGAKRIIHRKRASRIISRLSKKV